MSAATSVAFEASGFTPNQLSRPKNIGLFTFDFQKLISFAKNRSFVNLEKPQEPDVKTKYLSLPYLNDKSEKIAVKLKNLVKVYFNKINLRVAFKSPAELGDHFPFKDQVVDPTKLSNVVYHIKCKNCSDSYIGMSTRICAIRMEEHMKVKGSHVYLHHVKEGHEMDFDNIKILDRASNELKLQYKEMLFIRKLNPSLNKQTNSELFTLIIRNVQQETSITRDFQKYLKPKPKVNNVQ